MGGFLQTIGLIILFILFLSLLVIVHELGHFACAKAFKVYCSEFSIGFGPKLFSKKRKNGETTFVIRSIPFGGYVSMYGEGENVEAPKVNGVPVGKERSFTGIKKWKRAIILVAGVSMNAVLALVMFFISNQFFIQKQVVSNWFEIETKISETVNTPIGDALVNAGLTYNEGDLLTLSNDLIAYAEDDANKDNPIMVISKTGYMTFSDESLNCTVALVLDKNELTGYELTARTIENFVSIYKFENSAEDIILKGEPLIITSDLTNFSFTLDVKYCPKGSSEDQWVDKTLNINLGAATVSESSSEAYEVKDCGLYLYLYEYTNSFGKAISNTFADFGTSATAIFKSFGQLITDSSVRESASGIIGIGFQTSDILKSFGWSKFIYIWAFISVNLAIVNLFPFPGLDGWQLLVLIVEGITKKEIPNKVKSIMSIIGIGLLFILMGLLVFKDIFTFIF